jgi:electron transfer flavoprotein alpha subunit
MSDIPAILALIPGCGQDPAADRALMSHARQLADRCGGSAHAVLAGPPDAREAALAVARAAGLDHAWFIPAPSDAMQMQQYVDLFASALQADDFAARQRHAVMLVAAHSDNEAFAGALAARVDAMPLGRCTGLEVDAQGTLHARRGGYGNRLDITLSCSGAAIAAVRPRSADAPPRSTATHLLEGLPAPRAAHPLRFLPRDEPHAALDGARVVVSGGRGIGNEAGFPMLYEIAARLGGAVGASLPAVDAGWAPVTRQVGVSGRYVSPDVYLAVGISGTPQHLAGIDPHTRIVAINKDAEADIFDVAEAGAVAEWQALLPALLAALGDANEA